MNRRNHRDADSQRRAASGTDLGILSFSKSVTPAALEATWLAPEVPMGARLSGLESARYGKGELVIQLWAELTASGWSASAPMYFTTVLDRTGAVCRPKTPLDTRYGASALATIS